MGERIAEVDAYIERAAPFAQPVLLRIRDSMHETCPEIREVMKWSTPHFELNTLVAGMAAFKAHVGFGFWRSKEMKDPAGLFGGDPKASMCSAKLTGIGDLPSEKVLAGYIREAVALDKSGKQTPKKAAPKRAAKDVAAPPDLLAALKKNKAAREAFDGFSYSHRKEYVEWITEAKRDETRARRIAQAVEMMAEGKSKNWKYR